MLAKIERSQQDIVEVRLSLKVPFVGSTETYFVEIADKIGVTIPSLLEDLPSGVFPMLISYLTLRIDRIPKLTATETNFFGMSKWIFSLYQALQV